MEHAIETSFSNIGTQLSAIRALVPDSEIHFKAQSVEFHAPKTKMWLCVGFEGEPSDETMLTALQNIVDFIHSEQGEAGDIRRAHEANLKLAR